jgi:hypothetical protein
MRPCLSGRAKPTISSMPTTASTITGRAPAGGTRPPTFREGRASGSLCNWPSELQAKTRAHGSGMTVRLSLEFTSYYNRPQSDIYCDMKSALNSTSVTAPRLDNSPGCFHLSVILKLLTFHEKPDYRPQRWTGLLFRPFQPRR